MLPEFGQDPVLQQGIRFLVNTTGMLIFIFGLFYRRYRDKELATVAGLFNIFVFAVLTVLSSVDFGVAAGFGLFAILALFTLRSEPLGKMEMAYFFGSVSIAVICSISGTSFSFVGVMIAMILIGTYVIDHPRILAAVAGARITLDRIPDELISDPASMRKQLSDMLNVQVLSYQVLQIDYITEMSRLNVFYRKH